MLVVFIFIAFLLFLPSGAQAGPGHQLPDAEPSSKRVNKEIRSMSSLFKKESKASRKIWRLDLVQEPWQIDKACLRQSFLTLDSNSSIDQVRALYTLSAMRAISLQTLGPDGKRHTSFQKTLFLLQKKKKAIKHKGLKRLLGDKILVLKSIKALPRYQKSLCPLLQDWHEAGEPDIFVYTGLQKYSFEIQNFHFSKKPRPYYSLYDPIFSLFDLSTEQKWMKAQIFFNWFTSTLPYLEGFRANARAWENWAGGAL